MLRSPCRRRRTREDRERRRVVDRPRRFLQNPRSKERPVASYRRIEVKPIAGALGAEIAGVDLGNMDEHPEILEIIKEEGDTRAFGEVWHTDQMFNPKPAKATILYAKETPDAGGDTLFANMYLAYEALSDTMKELLER